MTQIFREKSTRLRIAVAIAASIELYATLLNGQGVTPSREYIRLGDRVVAIENPASAISISPTNVTIGSYDQVQFSASVTGCTSNCVLWSDNSNPSASINSTSGYLEASQSVRSRQTVTVEALVGNAFNNTAVTIVPLLSATGANYSSGGGTSSFDVFDLGSWSTSVASSGGPGITITGPPQYLSSGQLSVPASSGLVTVTYSVGGQSGTSTINLSGPGLSGSVYSGSSFNNVPFTITESSAPLSAGPSPIAIPGVLNDTVTTGSNSFNVNGGPWIVQESSLPTSPAWLYLPSTEGNLEETEQTTSAPVSFDYVANTMTSPRQVIVCLDYPPTTCSTSVTVNQSGGLQLSPPSGEIVLSSPGTANVTITAPTGTSWTAAVDPSSPWLTISQGSGTDSGTLTVTAPSYSGPLRTGLINIGGQEYTVYQSGTTTVTITPPAYAFYQKNSSPFTFSATDGNNTPLISSWTLLSPAYGSIPSGNGSSTGYTAPNTVTGPVYDYLKATDVANTSASSTAAILLNYGSGNGGLTWGDTSSDGVPEAFNTFQLTIPNFLANLTSQTNGGLQVGIAITTNPPGVTPWPTLLSQSCYMTLTFATGAALYDVFLADDLADAGGSSAYISPGRNTPGSGVAWNSQCEIDGTRSYMSYSPPLIGTSSVTVNLAILFRPGWAENTAGALDESVYIEALNSGTVGGYLFNPAQYGVWTSPGYGAPGVGITATSGYASGSTYPITGWALDRSLGGYASGGPQSQISSVALSVDGVGIGSAALHQSLPGGVTNYCSQFPDQTGITGPDKTTTPTWDCNGTQPNFGWSLPWNTTTLSNGTHTITAVAIDSDPNPHSSSVQQTFTVQNTQVATPVFSPGQGAYSGTQSVTISSATSGATILYTTNGTAPTCTSGTVYSVAVPVAASETLTAIACDTGIPNSNVASAAYTIGSGGTGWFNASWGYRKSITVNPNQVPSTQTNFPMLVSLTSDPDLAAHALSSGADIFFTDVNGSFLYYEREYYNSGTLIAWVNVSSLTNGTTLYMYFGNPSASDQQNPQVTWDSHYIGVYHLAHAPGGTSLVTSDSTSNANTGTNHGATSTSGQMDGAGAFSGTSGNPQYVDVGNSSSLQITGDLTIEAWANPTNYNTYNEIVGKTAGTGGNVPASFDFYIVGPGDGEGSSVIGLPRFLRGNESQAPSVLDGDNVVPTGGWNQVAVTMQGDSVVQYLNGATNGSATFNATVGDGGTDADIGSRTDKYTAFNGSMDEVRISNIARPVNWITTEYNNESSPSSFFTEGALQSYGQVTTPTFNPGGGTYSYTQSVSITTSTPGASINYTTDGSAPSETHGTAYSSAVSIGSTTTLKAIAYKLGMSDSGIQTATYTFGPQLSAPTFSPAGGTYTSTQTVIISPPSGASIRYTTDGSAPTETHGTFYVGPIAVNSTETIMAIAYEVGYTDSNVASASYTINTGGGMPWLGSAWQHRKAITVNSGQVPTTQTNFPMLVSLTSDSDLAADAMANGYDIIFTDSSGTNVLPYERELFTKSTGQLVAWVNVPSLSNGTLIYMYFGNGSQTTDPQNPTGTWNSNYTAVYHFPNGTTLTANDSTSNALGGTITGATATTGKIGGAASFDGTTGKYIDYGSGNLIDTIVGNYEGTWTIQAWFDANGNADQGAIFGDGNNANNARSMVINSGIGVGVSVFDGEEAVICSSGATLSAGWHHAVWTYNDGANILYLDGVAVCATTFSFYGGNYSGHTFTSLATSETSYGTPFNGAIDETEIASSAFTPAWITTEYNNQSAPSSFFAEGSLQNYGGGSSQVATPTFSPSGGNYSSSQIVTISTTTSGASIYYTTDGTTPTTSSNLYSSQVSVGSNLTLKAIGHESGMTDSAVASAAYTINWFNSSWQHRKAITVNSGQVPSTQTNFPMLVSLTSDSDLAADALANGYDIIFTDSSGTNVLPYERELFTKSTGQLVAWVNVPSLSNGTLIYMYFGNGSQTTDPQNPTGTWNSNYTAVYHFPNGTTLTANDSTSNANNGTNNGATATSGKIGGGASFNGSTANVSIPNATSIDVDTGNFTVSTWFNQASASSYAALFDKGSGSTGLRDLALFINGGGFAYYGVGEDAGPLSGSGISTGVWYYMTWVRSGSSNTIYLNASSNVTFSDSGNDEHGYALQIAGNPSGGGSNFNGEEDEFRISNIARSADWITTEYNNQSAPGFFTEGPLQ